MKIDFLKEKAESFLKEAKHVSERQVRNLEKWVTQLIKFLQKL